MTIIIIIVLSLSVTNQLNQSVSSNTKFFFSLSRSSTDGQDRSSSQSFVYRCPVFSFFLVIITSFLSILLFIFFWKLAEAIRTYVRIAIAMAGKALFPSSMALNARSLLRQSGGSQRQQQTLRTYSFKPRSSPPSTLQLSQRPIQQRRLLQPSALSLRRNYADAPSATLSPGPEKKRAGFFRWTWRLVQLGALGTVGWIGYEVYMLRRPHEQFDPDPSKKTLVVLGMRDGRVSLWR